MRQTLPSAADFRALRKRALDGYRMKPGEKSFGQRIREIVESRDRDRNEPDAWWFA